VDDHRILREGIRAILERTLVFSVVGEAETASDSVRLAAKLHPDLVLMDIGMPGMNGIEATAEILRESPKSKVIMLSIYDDENTVMAAFRSGARAFVLKKASAADLLDALRTAAQGGSYLNAQVSDQLLNRIRHGDLGRIRETAGPLEDLTPRERQILRLVAEGKTSKEIAALLDVKLQTVRTARKVLMKKTGATTIAGLTLIAIAAGLTTTGRSEAG
jgi:DNA-binding NarL/FixJ family response regulator